MATITTLNLWKDVGYTDGCMELPAVNNVLPSPDLVFTDLNPTKNRMFSEIRVPEDYVTLLDYSYMSITVDNNNGSDMTFYGWIDSVDMLSDTLNAPITQINWHVDLWRTYMADAEFGSGMVKRRRASGDLPPQNPSYRYLTPGTAVDVLQNDGIWWVIVALTKDVNVGTTENPDWETTLEYRVVPVKKGNFYTYDGNVYISSNKRALSLKEIFRGSWDESWGIDPEKVISVFLSPLAPTTYTGTGSQASPINANLAVAGEDEKAYYEMSGNRYPFVDFYGSFGTGVTYTTTDTVQYAVRGFDGETIGILPWGIPVRGVYARLVYNTTSAYIQLRFITGTTEDYTLMHQYGLTYNLPCLALDVTANTWSSYVYSGQRQYDMDQRKLSSEASAVSGGLSIGASALTGAASGAMLGSVVPGIGTLLGGAVGALGGVVSGAISTGGNYLYETNYKNDEMQRMEDYAHAMQADGLLLPGGGIDCIFYGCGLTLVPLSIDSYSSTQYTSDMTLYGAKVSEPVSNCTALISAGGPLQIENLIVKGDIPPVAKEYIKQRFAQGVIIV